MFWYHHARFVDVPIVVYIGRYFLIFLNCKRFAQSAGPGFQRVHFWSSFSLGSEKGRLLELIFALGGLFCVIFGSFFEPWEHFGSTGGTLFDHKSGLSHQRRHQRQNPGYKVILWVPFSYNFFNTCWIFGALFLSFVFF